MNGPLRQYFPKGTDLSRYKFRELQAVAYALNTRPRRSTVGELQRKCLPNRYTRPHGTLLRRPVESAHLCVGVLVQHRQAYAPPRADPSNRVRGHETTLNTVPTDRSHTNDTVCIRLGMVHSAR